MFGKLEPGGSPEESRFPTFHPTPKISAMRLSMLEHRPGSSIPSLMRMLFIGVKPCESS